MIGKSEDVCEKLNMFFVYFGEGTNKLGLTTKGIMDTNIEMEGVFIYHFMKILHKRYVYEYRQQINLYLIGPEEI